MKILYMAKTYLLRLGLFSTVLSLPLSTLAEIDSGDEQVTRLSLQGQIDTKAPFSKTLWAGAHNAFASYQWNDGTYTDVNQWYAPSKLFQRGIRIVEFDTYPHSVTSSTPKLCHLGLEESTICNYMFWTAASLGDGLDELEDYLEDNRDQVLMLKFEVYDSDHHKNFRNKVGEKIEKKLGEYVFKPSDWGYSNGDCASLPVQTLTKQDVLNAGKNIVMITQIPRDLPDRKDDDLCDYHDESHTSKMLKYVWIGVDEMDARGNLTSNEPLCQNSSLCTPDANGNESVSTHYDNGNFSVALDATTEYKKKEISKYGDAVQKWAEKGANLMELALVEANATTIGASKAPQIEDYVWSWDTNEPNSSRDDCAINNSDKLINDDKCSKSRYYACVDNDRNWVVSTGSGVWKGGFAQCASEGYSFGMPYNARENQDLLAAKAVAKTKKVWLNYHDQNIEGFWQANEESYLNIGFKKSSTYGGSGGSAFDGIDLLKRKLLSNGGFNLKSLQIRSGSRVDGFKVCYEVLQGVGHASVGTSEICRTWGGSGGSWGRKLTLDTTNGEYLEKVTVWTNKKNGNDRVFYLKFNTNKNNSISGGSTSGTKRVISTSGKQIFGFHGRKGSEIDAFGIYQINSSLIDAELYATDWLDRDNPDRGDNEKFSKHKASGNISSSCSTSDVAGYVARVVDNKLDASLSGQVVGLDKTDGFYCWNSSNGGNSRNTTCLDYEVKYFFTNANCLPI